MKRFARVVTVGGAGLLSACGSGGPATTGKTAPVPVTIMAPQGGTTGRASAGVTMIVGTTGQTVRVGASREAIWGWLPAAYESLGLPVSIMDATQFRIGNDQIKARRALNGVQMRAILDCGSDLNGEKAETYDIRMSIETSVAPSASADTAEVTTIVSGLGRSPNFGTSDVTCTTKGELERRILRFIRVQLRLKER